MGQTDKGRHTAVRVSDEATTRLDALVTSGRYRSRNEAADAVILEATEPAHRWYAVVNTFHAVGDSIGVVLSRHRTESAARKGESRCQLSSGYLPTRVVMVAASVRKGDHVTEWSAVD